MSNKNEFEQRRKKVSELITEIELGLSKSEPTKTEWDKMIKRLGDIHRIYGQITTNEKHNLLVTIALWVRVYYSNKYSYYYIGAIRELMKSFVIIAKELFELS